MVASLGPQNELIKISILMGERGLGIGLDEDMQVSRRCESVRCCQSTQTAFPSSHDLPHHLLFPQVTELAPGGPAQAAGVRVGDVLCVLNGLRVAPTDNIPELLGRACHRDEHNVLEFRRYDAQITARASESEARTAEKETVSQEEMMAAGEEEAEDVADAVADGIGVADEADPASVAAATALQSAARGRRVRLESPSNKSARTSLAPSSGGAAKELAGMGHNACHKGDFAAARLNFLAACERHHGGCKVQRAPD